MLPLALGDDDGVHPVTIKIAEERARHVLFVESMGVDPVVVRRFKCSFYLREINVLALEPHKNSYHNQYTVNKRKPSAILGK